MLRDASIRREQGRERPAFDGCGLRRVVNDVMRVLTIIASIFIPMTFVASIYGMNFAHMPELTEPWGYPVALITMLAIGLLLLVYFRRKRWL